MKKLLTLSIALTMAVSLCACGSESKDSTSVKTETTTAAEELTPADQLLEDVKGTYDELFTVICDPKYDQIWIDKCEAFVGEDMAESCAEMLKSSCTATIYGDEAVEAYSDAESMKFDCFFINGVKQFVFDGDNISGLDAALVFSCADKRICSSADAR